MEKFSETRLISEWIKKGMWKMPGKGEKNYVIVSQIVLHYANWKYIKGCFMEWWERHKIIAVENMLANI